MKINITIEIDDKELKSLLKEDYEKKSNYMDKEIRKNIPIWSGEYRWFIEEIVSKLNEIMEKYAIVSVVDMYDVIREYDPVFSYKGNYIDNKYGWTNKRNPFHVIRVDTYGYSIGWSDNIILLD